MEKKKKNIKIRILSIEGCEKLTKDEFILVSFTR